MKCGQGWDRAGCEVLVEHGQVTGSTKTNRVGAVARQS